jgi:hemin uptake protein HemP
MPTHHAYSSSPGAVRPLPAKPEKPALQRHCKRINSQQLLANEREIEIEHVGQLYRLRVTALGKLILTK